MWSFINPVTFGSLLLRWILQINLPKKCFVVTRNPRARQPSSMLLGDNCVTNMRQNSFQCLKPNIQRSGYNFTKICLRPMFVAKFTAPILVVASPHPVLRKIGNKQAEFFKPQMAPTENKHSFSWTEQSNRNPVPVWWQTRLIIDLATRALHDPTRPDQDFGPGRISLLFTSDVRVRVGRIFILSSRVRSDFEHSSEIYEDFGNTLVVKDFYYQFPLISSYPTKNSKNCMICRLVWHHHRWNII